MTRIAVRLVFTAVACVASAVGVFGSVVWSEYTADVVILGEFHDNAAHHWNQQNAVDEIRPTAVVFEMLTPDEAAQLGDVPRDRAAMLAATTEFHWSNIADYAGVLARSDVIVGAALSRDDMRAAFSDGAASVFGAEAVAYGLTTPLSPPEQSAREAAQFDAHCAAMPTGMMGGMVQAQRLRDATFARAVVAAIDTYGTPVILITGNGHARVDWGVPVYLSRFRPDLDVASVGQGEDGRPPAGVFTYLITDAPAPTRGDPCAAFAAGD